MHLRTVTAPLPLSGPPDRYWAPTGRPRRAAPASPMLDPRGDSRHRRRTGLAGGSEASGGRRVRGPHALAIVALSGAASIAVAGDLAALPDRKVSLRLDDIPLESALELLLSDAGAALAFDTERVIEVDLRYTGTLHGLLGRFESEHGLSILATNDAGTVGVRVRDSGFDDAIGVEPLADTVASDDTVADVGTADEAEDEAVGGSTETASEERTMPIPRVAAPEPAASVTGPAEIDDIPGFDTF